jgi:dTDP-4-amino-4,6-dideoxygalactose transaminase
MRIPSFTLQRLLEREGPELLEAIRTVMERGLFLLGPETEAFERELGDTFAAEAVAVGNGTDALIAALLACGVEPGSEVVVPAMTFSATAIAPAQIGATPVVVDVRPRDLLLDLEAAVAALTPRTSAVIPVHLYGQVQDLRPLLDPCRERGIAVIEDAAHSVGAEGLGSRVQGDAAAASFYPTKNLGAWGDAGAVITPRPEVAEFVRGWRHYGERDRFRTDSRGRNSRIDEVQAAILRRRLPALPGDLKERRLLANAYEETLPAGVRVVGAPRGEAADALHLFAVRVEDRDGVRAELGSAGIGTGVHYPTPTHDHPGIPVRRPVEAPVAEAAARELVSLPLFPGMRVDEVIEVCVRLGGKPVAGYSSVR